MPENTLGVVARGFKFVAAVSRFLLLAIAVIRQDMNPTLN